MVKPTLNSLNCTLGGSFAPGELHLNENDKGDKKQSVKKGGPSRPWLHLKWSMWAGLSLACLCTKKAWVWSWTLVNQQGISGWVNVHAFLGQGINEISLL